MDKRYLNCRPRLNSFLLNAIKRRSKWKISNISQMWLYEMRSNNEMFFSSNIAAFTNFICQKLLDLENSNIFSFHAKYSFINLSNRMLESQIMKYRCPDIPCRESWQNAQKHNSKIKHFENGSRKFSLRIRSLQFSRIFSRKRIFAFSGKCAETSFEMS